MKHIAHLFAFALLSIAATAQTSLQKRLDSLTAAYEQTGHHGVILVAKGKEVLYTKGYGLANFEKKIAHTPNTLFKTESVGKMFTAVSVMQLVEKGMLRLDETVKSILPETQIKNADKITIHHLLNHTSGMQSPWDSPKWTFKKIYSKAELINLIEEMPLVFETPGKEMYYSNSGYIVLGWIIEKRTGLSFDQYVQKNIFTKLGMKYTRHLMDTAMPVAKGAQPYRIINSKKHVPMTETVGPKANPAGGWISTAGDLHLFMAALYEGRLLKPKTLDVMRTANGTAPKDSSYRFYAYGLETFVNQLIPGVNLYGHNGGGAGFSIDAFVDPATGYIVTSCTNLHQNSRPIMANYLKAVMSKPIVPVKSSATVRLYDLIEEKGIDSIIANSNNYFAQLNIKVHPGFFAQMGEDFIAVKDYTNWDKWMRFAITQFPKEAYLLIVQGEGFLQMADKINAAKSFEAAKTIATANNDQRALQAAEENLKAL